MIDSIIDSLQWSIPFGRDPEKQYIKAEPNETFWKMYRSKPEIIKRYGMFISQNTDGSWSVLRRVEKLPEVPPLFLVNPETLENIKLKTEHFCKPHQIEHLKNSVRSLKNYKCLADTSETGTGKTATNILASIELGKPIFVICPLSVKPGWRKLIKLFGANVIDVMNYEMLVRGKNIYVNIEQKKNRSSVSNKVVINNIPKDALIIFDEAHKLNNPKTKASAMAEEFHKSGYTIALLSATLADNPLQMKTTGLILGLFNKPNQYWPWAMRHGVIKNGFNQMEFPHLHPDSYKYVEVIKSHMFPLKASKMTRGIDFPENLVLAESYELSDKVQIDKIYKEMQKELMDLKTKEITDVVTPLTIRLRARQKIELLKVPIFVELAENMVADGNSVAIFVNFRETIESIKTKLKTDCIIEGGQTPEVRESNRINFQNGDERVIVCNIRAGGVAIDLHDEHGNYPRVSIISPTDSAKDLIQALGRTPRSGSHSNVVQKIVFVADTIEDKIRENVQAKINRLNTLNDTDLDIS